MKINFFSLSSIKEIKIILFIEVIIILLGIGIYNTLDEEFIYQNNLRLLNITGLFCSILLWILASLIDYKKYFNIGAFLSTIIFSYFIFWFIFSF